jgi:hypothetical protein
LAEDNARTRNLRTLSSRDSLKNVVEAAVMYSGIWWIQERQIPFLENDSGFVCVSDLGASQDFRRVSKIQLKADC